MSTPISAPPIQCKICNKKLKDLRGLSIHIRAAHNTSPEHYYRTYIDQNIPLCATCKGLTKFKNIVKGYQKFCSTSCSNRNLESIKLRVKSGIETCRNDPSILEKRIKSRIETIKNDPTIMQRLHKKRKATFAANPNIQASISKNIKQAYSTPEAKLMVSKRNSINLRNFYNNLQQNKQDSSTSVYILSHSSLDIIKIGITSNINSRIKTIKATFGSVEIIKTITTTHTLALDLEKRMHNYFKEHCKVQPKGDGRTEWFDNCITDEALKMLETDYLSHSL